VLESRYNFISNGYFIDVLFDEAYRSDGEVMDRQRQLEALAGLDAEDIEDFIALLIGTDDRIDVRVTPNG
jgi:hypothetical protein